MYRKNVASQFIHFQGVDATTGGIKSGVTWTIRRCIDGTFAAATGTVTEDGTAGWYKMALSQADTNGNDIGFNFTGTGAVPQTVNIVTTACDPTVATNFGITALPATAVTTNASLLTSGTGSDQLSVASGRIDVGKLLGTAWLTPGVAGTPDVNVKLWNNLTTVALPLIPTVAGRTLDCSAGGEAGVDWANVGTPGSTVNLSATTTNLVNTLTTYTGNTVQTGDSFARLGVAGVGLTNLGDTRIANLDATVSSRLATSGYTAPPTAAQNAAAVLTTQMTESYAALHTVPTLAQIMFEMRGLQGGKTVATTLLTINKIDGSTPAEVFTLDSATAPTSINRTT